MPKGLIIGNISNIYEVEDIPNGDIVRCFSRGKLKKDDSIPVVGDEIEYECQGDGTGVIEKITKRKNYVKRPKISNITQIILVVSMKMPKPDLLLLDKQLAFAEFNGIRPIICLNKIDLEDESKIEEIAKIYRKIGYEVIKTNAKTGDGIHKIEKVLDNNVTAFSGNSGVGKSTLLNNIFKESVTAEGNISEKNKRGKNTTTSVRLYKIKENSYIADTPGFSTFDIGEIESKDLSEYFIDMRSYVAKCEFVGCTHIKEEECGVKKALQGGEISKLRYDSYCKIYNELKEMEAHKW